MNRQNPFGVLEFLHWNHPWNNYKYPNLQDIEKSAALMKEAGVGWVRMDLLWEDIEPKEQEFDFKKYDGIVRILDKNKINILGLLNYGVPWANKLKGTNYPPEDFRSFCRYAAKTAARYKDKIKYWEVWNEPDSPTYWATQDGLKGYCALLKDVYLALKNVDPDCRVLNGGLANGLPSVSRLYDNGAKDYFDILNIHIFQPPLGPGAIKEVKAYPESARSIMERNGDSDKKIWVTEIGCPGVGRGVQTEEWWLGQNPDEGLQAEWLKSIFRQLLKDKTVEKIFWAFFRDCKGHWGNGVDYFGLLRWDYSRKPSFKAYRECFNSWEKSERI